MEAILKSLSDPSWWFTGLFFVLVALALPRVFGYVLRLLRSIGRRRRAQTQRKIKLMRVSSGLVQYAIGRANSHYTLFLALACGFLLLLPVLSALNGGKIPVLLVILIAIPILALELAWLVSDKFVRELIAARARLLRHSTLPVRRDL